MSVMFHSVPTLGAQRAAPRWRRRAPGAGAVRAVPAAAAALALGVFAAPLAPVARGQTAAAAPLQETVVTATRSEQPLDGLLADVSVVERETIERSGATGLADLLARLPGVECARNGGAAAATSIFLRGSEARHAAVYIDGVRVDSQAAAGGAQWEQIPLAQIERIEVLRGPAAAVWGSDAIGGVVQLFTRKGEGPARPYLGLTLGSQRSRRIEAGVSGSAGVDGAVDYALGLAHEASAGFDAWNSGVHDPDRDGYRGDSGHARIGLRIAPRQRIGATLLANRMNAGYDAYGYNAASPVDERSLLRLRSAAVDWSAQWSDAYGTRIVLSDALGSYATRPAPFLSQTRLRGYLWQNEYRLGAQRLSATLERREDALQHTGTGAAERARAQNALALGYGLGAGRHVLQANWRHDQDSGFGGQNTGSLSYGYAFAPGWRATASLGTAFRAPTLYQRFSQYGVTGLQPEHSRNAEVALRYAQGASAFSVVAYRNRVGNLISFGAPGACASRYGCYTNTARAQYQGLTLTGAQRLQGLAGLPELRLHAALDLQNPRDQDSGKLLARRARQHATLGADARLADWTLGGELQASGRRFDDAANTQPMGGYTLLNLYASTRLARDYSLLARIDNLADKGYELARGYSTPGRTLYLAVKWAPQPAPR